MVFTHRNLILVAGEIVFVEKRFEHKSYNKAYNALRGHTDFGRDISGNEPYEYASDGDGSQ